MRISTSEFFHLLLNVKVRMVIFFSKAKKSSTPAVIYFRQDAALS